MLLFNYHNNFISSENRRNNHKILPINFDEINNENAYEIIRLYNPYFENMNSKSDYKEIVVGIILITFYVILISLFNFIF